MPFTAYHTVPKSIPYHEQNHTIYRLHRLISSHLLLSPSLISFCLVSLICSALFSFSLLSSHLLSSHLFFLTLLSFPSFLISSLLHPSSFTISLLVSTCHLIWSAHFSFLLSCIFPSPCLNILSSNPLFSWSLLSRLISSRLSLLYLLLSSHFVSSCLHTSSDLCSGCVVLCFVCVSGWCWSGFVHLHTVSLSDLFSHGSVRYLWRR